ncbi:hypothetical protein KHC27_07925 [Ancylobacter lacus]|nr:hypothetical protein [Ancylobacter lacus]
MRRFLLWATLAVLAASLIGVGTAGWRLARAARDNAAIDALAAGRDLPLGPAAGPEAAMARLHFLLLRGRLDEARPVLAAVVARGAPALAAAALYDTANARLRKALEHLEVGQIDAAIPLVRLAKDSYRRALLIDPSFWDAKYNLDIAMRLVRDFPQLDQDGEEPPPEAAKRLWTDLPGIPKGLP